MKQFRAYILILIANLMLAGLSMGGYHMPDVGAVGQPTTKPYTDDEVGVDQSRTGAPIPLDAVFTDDTGNNASLGSMLKAGRPVILNIGYYNCPMLCGLVNRSMIDALRGTDLGTGKDYDVVNVSLDSGEQWMLGRDKKKAYITAMGQPDNAAGWHFLVGSPDSVDRLTRAVGYKYKPVTTGESGELAHPAVLIIVSPDGKVMRYLPALQLDQKTLRLSLIEASNGQSGSFWDQAFLTCFRFDPNTGKYSAIATSAMQIAGLLTLVIFFAIMIPLWIKSAKKYGLYGKQDPAIAPEAGK